jgi:hypothetical protein
MVEISTFRVQEVLQIIVSIVIPDTLDKNQTQQQKNGKHQGNDFTPPWS